MDGSERAVMLKRGPPWRSKEAGTRGGGVPPPPPGLQGGPSPAAEQVATQRLALSTGLKPSDQKRKPHLFQGGAGGRHTALRLPQLFLDVIAIMESCCHELIFKYSI